MIDAGFDLTHRVLARTDQGGAGDARLRARSSIEAGGTPSALAISWIGWRKATSISFFAGLELIGRRAVRIFPA